MPATCDTGGGACDSEPDAEPPLRLHLDIVDDAGDWGAFPQIESAVRRAATALSGHPAIRMASGQAACVALSSSDAVRRLNREFRGQDKPTNVLSFPATRGMLAANDTAQLGDVILAAEVVLAEAAEAGIVPVHHLQHLIVHGLLHLLGYTHEAEADAAEMERLEIEILSRIGVANPYSARV